MVSFLQSLLLLFHFCVFLSQLSELIWKLAEEISLQSASKRFPSFGLPANGNKSNAKKSWFLPNRNLTGTMYHWSVILRSFSVVLNSAKPDANGFFKVLLLSSHLLISRHPVQKLKFGGCALTEYCSFKLRLTVMFSNLEYRERERQRKRESRATGQRSSTRKGARAREKKQKETFSVGGTIWNFVAARC